MTGRRSLRIVWFCLCIVLSINLAQAAELHESLTLKDAIRRGLESSAAMQQAHFKVQWIELEYKQAEVNARSTVTPLQLAEIKQAYENALYETQLLSVQIALHAESRYYAVMKAVDTLDLRNNALDRALQQVDIAHRRHGSGQITDVQLREAEQRLKEAELAHRQAMHTVQLARMELNQLVGLSGPEWVLTDEVTFERQAINIDEALASAETRRFELIQAQQQIETAEQAVQLADNSYTPKIELEQARILLAQAELNLHQKMDQVRHEVWSAALRLEDAEGRFELAQDRLGLAEENLDLAELRYQNGLNTLLDVLQAESTLAEAHVEAVAATYDYNVARAEYLSAIGLGFERWPEVLERVAGGSV